MLCMLHVERKLNVMKYSKEEQETHITYNELEKVAYVYTLKKSLIKRLLQYCKEFPNDYKLEKTDGDGHSFITPKRLVQIRKPKVYTQEQKDRMKQQGERLKATSKDKDSNIA